MEKTFLESLKNGWNNYEFSINNVPLTNSILSFVLSSFWKEVVDKLEGKPYHVILKVKFEDGSVRSISSLQRLKKESFEEMDSVFNDFWNLRSEDYHLMPVKDVVLSYRLSDNDLPSKIIKAKDLVSSKDKPSFIFKGYSLPNTMDLYEWGNAKFNEDYTNGIIITSKSISYKVNLITNNVNESKTLVNVFSNNKFLFSFIDELYNSSDLSSFKRNINKQEFIFHNGVLVLKTIKRGTKFIQKLRPSQFRSTKFITMDIETRKINNVMSIVCISYYDGLDFYSFYLKNYDSELDMISSAFKSLCIRKYTGYRIYFHNFSYFDAVFLLKALTTLYKIKPVKRDGAIIELKINYDKGVLYIHDSLLLLPNSLDSLGKSFNVEAKGIFPYEFINNINLPLDYNGNIPDYKYYDSKKVSLEKYEEYVNNHKLNNSTWDLEKELIEYCELDVKVLYQVINKFSEEIFNLYRVDVIKYPTLPSLAFSIFRTRFMKNENIPIILGEIYNDIYSGYTGGSVDVYKPSGRKIYSYDINSLYPTAMCNYFMPVGNPIYFEGDISLTKNNPYGFFYVKINAPINLHKPVLQLRIRTASGIQTIAPVGNWEGWYFSEELSNAVNNFDYKVEIIKGYLFQKDNIFKDYVETLYKIKEENSPGEVNADPSKCSIAKFLLNMLYGRFGMSPDISDHLILTNEEAKKYYDDYVVTDITDFQNGYELIEFFNEKVTDVNSNTNVSVAVSATVTAYARIIMSQYKRLKNNEMLYTDTDSGAFEKPLSNDCIGKGLGKMKLEYVLDRGTYLAAKVYGGIYDPILSSKIIEKKGPEIVKVKGLKNPVSYFDLEPLLYINANKIVSQDKWYRNFDKENITVQNEIYTLKVTGNKRELIYDSMGKFVATKPFELKNGKIIRKEPTILYYLPLNPLTKIRKCLSLTKISSRRPSGGVF